MSKCVKFEIRDELADRQESGSREVCRIVNSSAEQRQKERLTAECLKQRRKLQRERFLRDCADGCGVLMGACVSLAITAVVQNAVGQAVLALTAGGIAGCIWWALREGKIE